MNNPVIEELYLKDEKLSALVPEEIIKWATEVMDENWTKAKDAGPKQKAQNKIVHTKEVVKAGWEIMENEKSIEWDKKIGTIVCFLHDIGRFPQIHSNTFIDADSGIDHASLGSEMFLKEQFDVPAREEIAEAIYWHSRKENQSTSPYAKLARDADKTALFRIYDLMEKGDTRAYNLTGNEIREEKLNDFLNNTMTPYSGFRSVAEWYLFNGTWLSDLNFEATKNIFRQEKYPEMLLNKFKALGIDFAKLALIEQKFTSF